MLVEKSMFRVVAGTPGTTRDLLVEDLSGTPRLFLHGAGTVTRKPLHPDLVSALFRSGRMRVVEDDGWYSVDELRDVAAVS